LDALSLCSKSTSYQGKVYSEIDQISRFSDYQGTTEEKACDFVDRARRDPVYAFNSVLKFFQSKREQIDRKEMAIGTVRNYVKSIKLFCDMAEG
jgi:hypothetical protein